MLLFIQTHVYALESVLMQVYVNQEEKGEWFFHLDGGVPLFTLESLRSMGMAHLSEITTKQFDGVQYVSLQTLQPHVVYRIDERESALYIDASPELFRIQVISQSFYNAPTGLEHASDISAYANYGLDFSREGDSNIDVLNIPLSLVFHNRDTSIYSDFLYSNKNGQDQFVRLLSAVTHDDRESLTRLTLGDFAAATGANGGGGIFGGLSYSRNFSINPYYNRYTGLTVNGVVNTPSQVEYFVGERLMFSQRVSPGEFEIQEMTPPVGAHQTRVVITDDFGSEYVMDGEIYFASRQLKPGIHEFSYNAGFRRENLGRSSTDYGKPAALAVHHVGITDRLTLGGNGELDSDLINLGGDASFILPLRGQMNASLSMSNADNAVGYASSLSYQYASSRMSAYVRLRAISRNYANLNMTPDSDKTRFEWQTGLALNSSAWGSWTASYASRELHSGIQTRRATLSFSLQIARFASLIARYTRLGGDLHDEELFVGIGHPLGIGRSGAVEYRKNSGISRLSARLSKNRSLGPGFGYNLNVGLQGSDRDALFAAEYAGSAGVYSAGYRRINGKTSYRAGMFGSVALIGGNVHFSRPIRDSFALIKVDELADVDVRFNNQFAGQTNRNGELLIPNLNSYFGNRISVNDHDIPIDYELAGFEKVAATPFRGGGIVAFDARRLQAFTGRLFIDENRGIKPAEYWGLRFELKEEPVQTVVGKSGEFYLENLPPGAVQAEIFSGDKACSFTFEIPESSEMLVNLGEITCELSK